MKTGIISFTEKGSDLAFLLFKKLRESGEPCEAWITERYLDEERRRAGMRPREGSTSLWAGERFKEGSALLFIGAAGIAVRSVAPHLKDKFTDPPVLVMDERGRFVVPILSGHVGGANALAMRISALTGAQTVITTATDVNGVFAADVFAKENHLIVGDRVEAKNVSSALLDGQEIGFFSDWELPPLPAGCVPFPRRQNIYLGIHRRGVPASLKEEGRHFLHLVPRAVILGIGLKKGRPFEALYGQVKKALDRADIDIRAVREIATIDRKLEEPALEELSVTLCAPLRGYSAVALERVAGVFRESEFVRAAVGVGNVCERAACAGGARLILEKQAGEGVTVAAALDQVVIRFP